jgi:glutathione S-transferase
VNDHYRLIGANASPYSVKIRAILRYRRLPFIWDRRNKKHEAEIRDVTPPTMPYLVYPDGTIHNDSSLLANDLEARHPGQRSILTNDPVLNFISHIIEDFGDEWVTRIMAHYRWNYETDQSFCSRWIAEEQRPGITGAEIEKVATAFRNRQMGRRLLLGVSELNRQVLEQSYKTLLAALTAMLKHDEFLFGSRPSPADFGLFGQLYQMSVDPTASAIMRSEALSIYAWIMRLDDASGIEGDWSDFVTPAVNELLILAGQTHLPLLVANSAAAASEQSVFRVELKGGPFEQSTSRYHVKCLKWLREEYEKLDDAARKRATDILETAGCVRFFAEERT